MFRRHKGERPNVQIIKKAELTVSCRMDRQMLPEPGPISRILKQKERKKLCQLSALLRNFSSKKGMFIVSTIT